jgi:Carboxypeptidase regulatory-like domain/TonB-dependent Receptor Plug Domain
MLTRLVRRTLALGIIAGAAAPTQVAAQAPQGIITGRVTDAASGQPIGAAQLAVVGTTLGAQTNTDGQYTIRGVNAGAVQVRVLRLGYGESRQSATVVAGQAATLNFQLTALPVTLNPVVTTATGQQRRIEVGNAIAQLEVANLVESKPVSGMADLLTSRAAGVLITPGTQSGAGTRIRIRGTSSLSLTNNPIVIIDGVRVESSTGSSSVSVGGTMTSIPRSSSPSKSFAAPRPPRCTGPTQPMASS